MIIQLKKFGTTLISRQTGREALLAIQAMLRALEESEKVEVDFEGVLTFSPSWGDEVLTPLLDKYGARLILKNTDNLSVLATIDTLQTSHGKKFKVDS